MASPLRMNIYVGGHYEALEACASIVDYADSNDYFIDALKIEKSGDDDWTISVAFVSTKVSEWSLGGEKDEIPF